MVVGRVVILLHGGFFEGTVQAFHLAIGPGMVGLGEAMVEAICLADAIEEMVERVLIALPVGELDAVIGEHGVALRGYGGDQVAQQLSGNHLARCFMPLGRGELADAVDRDAQVERTFCRTSRGHGEMAGANTRVTRQRLSG